MQVNRFDTYLDALAELRPRGYEHSFVADAQALRCVETDRRYGPADLTIVCYHRFEGDKDLGDVSILYVLETTDGCRGTLIDGYGTYADADLAGLLRVTPISADTRRAGLEVEF